MASEIYFNIELGHSKIWGYDFFSNDKEKKYTVITYYGKIGVPMYRLRKHEKKFTEYGKAYDYIWEKIRKKTNCNGYYQMPNSQYFDAILNGKPMSQIINLMEIYRKEQKK